MKARKNLGFLVFCSMLVLAIVWTYGAFQVYFSRGVEVSYKLKKMAIEAEASQSEVIRLKNQIKDLQFETALALASDASAQEARKKLLQSTRAPASADFDLSDIQFQRGKSLFEAQKWRTASRIFSDFIQDYPNSRHIAEVYFLLGEAYFRQEKYPEMLDMVEAMVTHFPESDMTGFLLLRQAQLSIHNNQIEEAQEVFHLIQAEFKNPQLLEQTALLQKSIQL